MLRISPELIWYNFPSNLSIKILPQKWVIFIKNYADTTSFVDETITSKEASYTSQQSKLLCDVCVIDENPAKD